MAIAKGWVSIGLTFLQFIIEKVFFAEKDESSDKHGAVKGFVETFIKEYNVDLTPSRVDDLIKDVVALLNKYGLFDKKGAEGSTE